MKYRYLSIFLSIGAVSAQENTTSDDVIGMVQDDTILSSSEYAIDDSNYDTYFNSTTGKLLENSNISDGDTLKLGNVSDKVFTIDRNLMITSNSTDSVAINTTFVIENVTGSTISDLTIKNDNASYAIYVLSSDNVVIENNKIELSGSFDSDAYAVYADFADNLSVNANVISYVGKTNGTGINNAIRVTRSGGVLIADNDVEINVPSVDVTWIPQSGTYVMLPVSEGIVLKNDTGLVFANNIINLNATDVVTESGYDTIYAVDVDSDNAVVVNNIIAANGKNYIYGLIISGENLTVSNNTIQSVSDSYYANGIDVEGPASGVFEI